MHAVAWSVEQQAAEEKEKKKAALPALQRASAIGDIVLKGQPSYAPNAEMMGVYMLSVGEVYGGRAVYRQHRSNDMLFLWYQSALGCWYVSNEVGGNGAGMQVCTDATTPADILALWQVADRVNGQLEWVDTAIESRAVDPAKAAAAGGVPTSRLRLPPAVLLQQEVWKQRPEGGAAFGGGNRSASGSWGMGGLSAEAEEDRQLQEALRMSMASAGGAVLDVNALKEAMFMSGISEVLQVQGDGPTITDITDLVSTDEEGKEEDEEEEERQLQEALMMSMAGSA
jgi:hypothetical protein